MPPLDHLATPAGYSAAMRAMHGFHSAWEPRIWANRDLEALGLRAAERLKLPLLNRDLATIGVSPAQPACPDPGPLGVPEALGALYVLEGATLGGQIILRRIKVPLRLSVEKGGAYYYGYGSRTGDQWKLFGEAVQRWVDRNGSGDRVVDAAADCFTAFVEWLHVPHVLRPEPARNRMAS